METNKIKCGTTAEDVSMRVRNTRKEIQDLKAELEILITSGINASKVAINDTEFKSQNPIKCDQAMDTHTSGTKPLSSFPIDVQKEQILNAPNTRVKLKLAEPIAQKTTEKPTGASKAVPEPEPGKRSKTYNRAETREWMKKRRERVTDDLRAKVKESQASIDIKKEKLRQLHEKCQLIVSANVQKRSRCKSADPISTQTLRSRSKSCDPLAANTDVKSDVAVIGIQSTKPLTKSAWEKRVEVDTTTKCNPNKHLSSADNINIKSKSNPVISFRQPRSSKTGDAKKNTSGLNKQVPRKCLVESKQDDGKSGSVSDLILQFENNSKEDQVTIGTCISKNLLSIPQEPLYNRYTDTKDLKATRVEFEKESYPISTLETRSNASNRKFQAKQKVVQSKSNIRQPLFVKHDSDSVKTVASKLQIENNKEIEPSESKGEIKNDILEKSESNVAIKARNKIKDKNVRNAITVRQLNDNLFDLAPHLSDRNNTDSVMKYNQTLQGSGDSQNTVLKSKKSELAIMTDSCNKVTKDTQTVDISYKLEESPWLQVPNNLNFINTVKEKLKAVIQSPGYLRDVGVQSSLVEHNLHNNISNTHELAASAEKKLLKDQFTDIALSTREDDKNSKSTNKKSSSEKRSELNSFLSQKLLDLRNSDSLQNIQSERNQTASKFTARSDILSTIKTATTDSDYDTSKNIPDISSELSLMQKHNAKTKAISENKNSNLEIHINKSKNLTHVNVYNRAKYDKKSSQSVETLKNLQEDTQSGELKNIPEISTGMSILSIHDSNSKSDEHLITLDKRLQSGANKESSEHKKLKSKDSMSLIQNGITIRSNSGYSIDFNSLKDSSTYKSSSDTLTSIRNPSTNTIKPSRHSSNSRKDSSLKHIDKSSVTEDLKDSNESSKLKLNENGDTYSSSRKSSSTRVRKHSQLSSYGTTENKSQSETSIHTRSSIEIVTEYSQGQASVPKKVTLRNADTAGDIVPLKEPSVRLEVDSVAVRPSTDQGKLFKTLSVTAGGIQNNEAQIKSNEIHLKFEAEVHLLNDFNESLKSFMAVEKAFETLKEKNGLKSPNTNHQTRDTQTSLQARTPITSRISEETEHLDSTQKQISGINYSRGSEIIDDLRTLPLEITASESKNNEDTFMSTTGLTGFELSNLNNTIESFVEDGRFSFSASNIENINGNNVTIKMFEQLIKEEDLRLENLKTAIRIREKSLLDRTKTELALLEIQRRHLKETGQLDKVSDIRKKQRGVILKHQHERNEMQKWKQIKKAESKERKLLLKQQTNFIKSQLSTNNMLSKIKVSTPRQKRRSSGPMRVLKAHNEVEITSDITVSRKSSITEEIIGIASHTSAVSSSEDTARDAEAYPLQQIVEESSMNRSLSHVKQALLMREAALEKRRKAAEELLKWHQRLLEEERKISELESAADIVINQIPSVTTADKDAQKFPFKGSQLNQLLHNMTGREDKEYLDDEMYVMSQTALEHFCRNSKELGRNPVNKRSDKIGDMYKDKSESINISVSSINDIPETSRTESVHTEITSQVDIQSVISDNIDNVYTSDFDNDSIKSSSEKQNELNRISSISELIDNFSKIKDEISLLSRKTERNISQINQDDDMHPNSTHPHKESGSSTSVMSTQLFTDDEKSSQMKTHSESISASIQSQLSPVSKEKSVSEHIKLKEGESSQKQSSEIITDLKVTAAHLKQDNNDVKLSTKTSGSVHTPLISSSSLHTVTSELSDNKNDAQNSLTTDGVMSSEVPKSDSSTEEGAKEHMSENKEFLARVKSTASTVTDKTLSVEPIEEDKVTSIENKFLETVEKSLNIVSSIGENTEDNTQASNDLLSVASGIKSRSGLGVDLKNVDVVDSVENVSSFEDIDVSSKIGNISELQSQHILSDQIGGITSGSIPESKKVTIVSSNKDLNTETPVSSDGFKNSIAEDISQRTSGNLSEITPKSERTYKNLDQKNSLHEEFPKSTYEPESVPPTHETSQNVDTVETSYESVKHDTPHITDKDVSHSLSPEDAKTCTLESKGASYPSKSESIHLELKNLDVDLKSGIYDVSKSHSLLTEGSESQKSVIQEELSQAQSQSVQQKLESLEPPVRSESDQPVYLKTLTVVSHGNQSESQDSIKEVRDISLKDEIDNHNADVTSKASDTSDYASEIAPASITCTATGNFQTKSDTDSTFNEANDAHSETNSKSHDNDKIIEEKIDSPASTVILNENEDLIDTESSDDLQDKSDDGESRKMSQSTSSERSHKLKTEEHITDGTIPASIEDDLHVKSDDLESSNVEASVTSRENLQSNTVSSLSVSENVECDNDNVTSSNISDLSTRDKQIDVKRRVSEILAEANQGSRGDKSPRLQDLYVTAYDIISPANSPETGSPEHKTTQSLVAENIFGDEAKELMMKQLAIEQEIKQIEEQQKEHIPYVYMREIPNKPPPPYTPPTPQQSSPTVLPTDIADIHEVTSYAANVLHKAYLNKNLSNVRLKECNFKLVSKRNISKSCCELLFDLCTELATNHYKQFDEPEGPSWLRIIKKPQMTLMKPFDVQTLGRYMNTKLKQLFGFEKPGVRESAIIKWSRKKRDYVDEIILLESQSEDPEWINYEKDEVLVKDELTSDLMNMLLSETADVFSNLLSKETFTH